MFSKRRQRLRRRSRNSRFEALEPRIVLNADPIGRDDYYYTRPLFTFNTGSFQGMHFQGSVLENDEDPDLDVLQAVLVDDVSDGALTFSGDGEFSYVPPVGFKGETTFTYRALDGNGGQSDITTVYMYVHDLPSARDDFYRTGVDEPLTKNANEGVLANDLQYIGHTYSLGGQNLAVTNVISGPYHGQLYPGPDGSFTYTPDQGYVGEDSWTYELMVVEPRLAGSPINNQLTMLAVTGEVRVLVSDLMFSVVSNPQSRTLSAGDNSLAAGHNTEATRVSNCSCPCDCALPEVRAVVDSTRNTQTGDAEATVDVTGDLDPVNRPDEMRVQIRVYDECQTFYVSPSAWGTMV